MVLLPIDCSGVAEDYLPQATPNLSNPHALKHVISTRDKREVFTICVRLLCRCHWLQAGPYHLAPF